ncbi:restart primosome assembly protein PriC [Colwellia chukchiensis]|uniref:Restart primosome assembly protein PriC n=1 Tax=Colwellia chukchiensis TaxID=641665 RepID=A0A1H7GKY2_9GAMM|nr:primosomal replication protein PriC [Colwellia chukchiensis]SEK38729.1 restart primosome assembly protein PriC [Colwellia chukchiensis]
MQTAINKILSILEQLSQQALALDQQNKQTKSHQLIQENDIFSNAIFNTHSDQFYPYVLEVKTKTAELSRLLSAKKNTLAHSRLQLIEQQISALRNALNANEALHKEPTQRLQAIKARRYKKAAQAVMHSSHSLHQKLAEIQEFERRLVAMIESREAQRQQANARQSDQLSKEILALHQRLGRCRQALSKIEREIAKSVKY